jgi:hypothetical protein
MKESEAFWGHLLDLIDEGKVIPVVGRDLLTLPEEAGHYTTLYPYLAVRLAGALGVPSQKLPIGDELNEVACRLFTQL